MIAPNEIPILCVVNGSTLVEQDAVSKAASAIQKQLVDFGEAGYQTATLDALGPNDTPPASAFIVRLVDRANEPGALGFHDNVKAPAGMVSVGDCIDDKVAWSSTLSHEILELLADPWATLLVQVGALVYVYEVCDPVEDQSYTIDGIEVSDFALPSWFRKDSTGPWNFNKDKPLPGPLAIAPGGYAQYAKLDGSGWQQVNGELVRASKQRAKPGSRRSRRILMAA